MINVVEYCGVILIFYGFYIDNYVYFGGFCVDGFLGFEGFGCIGYGF